MDDDFAFIDHDDQSDSGQPPIPSLRRIQFEIAPRGLTGFINQVNFLFIFIIIQW